MFTADPERLRALADELERDGEAEMAATARRAADELEGEANRRNEDPPADGSET